MGPEDTLSRSWQLAGSKSNDEYCLLGCDVMQSHTFLQTFKKNVLPPSPGYNSKTRVENARTLGDGGAGPRS
jgi:hypothetical protein